MLKIYPKPSTNKKKHPKFWNIPNKRVWLGLDLTTFFKAGLKLWNLAQAQIPVIIYNLAHTKKKEKERCWQMYTDSRWDKII